MRTVVDGGEKIVSYVRELSVGRENLIADGEIMRRFHKKMGIKENERLRISKKSNGPDYVLVWAGY